MTPFRREVLDNGVTVEFVDRSNRYFGDYHRICVEVTLRVALPDRPEPLLIIRHLDRMGVAGAEVEQVCERLADDFWRHARGYLGRPDYPLRLAAAEAVKPRRSPLTLLRHGR